MYIGLVLFTKHNNCRVIQKRFFFTMKLTSGTNRKLINIVFSIFLFNFTTIAEKINASVNYEVEGNGFHRTIRYRVDVGEFFRENCHVALRLSPDPTLYVNIDELADLRRRDKTTVCSEGEIDVELFAEKAQRQNITLCGPLGKDENILILPIHQRYSLPRDNEEYTNVTLPEPILLLGCRDRIKEYAVSKIDLCSPCVERSLKWRQIPYKMKTKNYVWMVPIGDLSDLNHVTSVTLVAVLVGAAMILRALWFSKDAADKKRN